MKKKEERKKLYLLGVPAKSDRPIIIGFEDDVPQLSIGYVFYYMPFDWEEPIPLVNLPEVHVFIKIYLPSHLS